MTETNDVHVLVELVRNNLPTHRQCQIDVPRFWVPMIAELHEKLLDIAPNYTLFDVLSKYAILSYDAVPGTTSELKSTFFYQLIAEVEDRSERICEACGAEDGTVTNAPLEPERTDFDWVYTLCTACRALNPETVREKVRENHVYEVVAAASLAP